MLELADGDQKELGHNLAQLSVSDVYAAFLKVALEFAASPDSQPADRRA